MWSVTFWKGIIPKGMQGSKGEDKQNQKQKATFLAQTRLPSKVCIYWPQPTLKKKKKVSEYLLHLNEDVWNYAILSRSIYTYPS